MAHYDSTKEYDNIKEMIMNRFIVPISLSHFSVISKFEYNTDSDTIEIEADDLVVSIGEKCKVIRGSPNKMQKSKLVKVKQWYGGWEEYLK